MSIWCLKINEMSELTGISVSALRQWDARYGWPLTRRSTNGYRVYSKGDVEIIKRVKSLMEKGITLREILKDGYPDLPPLPRSDDKPIKKIINRPEFNKQSSNEIAVMIEKSSDPVKYSECLIVSAHQSDKEILRKYAKDLSDNR